MSKTSRAKLFLNKLYSSLPQELAILMSEIVEDYEPSNPSEMAEYLFINNVNRTFFNENYKKLSQQINANTKKEHLEKESTLFALYSAMIMLIRDIREATNITSETLSFGLNENQVTSFIRYVRDTMQDANSDLPPLWIIRLSHSQFFVSDDE